MPYSILLRFGRSNQTIFAVILRTAGRHPFAGPLAPLRGMFAARSLGNWPAVVVVVVAGLPVRRFAFQAARTLPALPLPLRTMF